MDVVKAFNSELASLYECKPPISKAKMVVITKAAMKAIKYYKHVVMSVEKFIQKCKADYKVPGMYVIDSIVRQSRHQFGSEKDVFAPRFGKNMKQTLEQMLSCSEEDQKKVVRVLHLWLRNNVFPYDVIGPLLEYAAELGIDTENLKIERQKSGKENNDNVQEQQNRDENEATGRPKKEEVKEIAVEKEESDEDAEDNLGPSTEKLEELIAKNPQFREFLIAKAETLLFPEKINKDQHQRKRNIKNLLAADYEYSDDESGEDEEDKPAAEVQKEIKESDLVQLLISHPEIMQQFLTRRDETAHAASPEQRSSASVQDSSRDRKASRQDVEQQPPRDTIRQAVKQTEDHAPPTSLLSPGGQTQAGVLQQQQTVNTSLPPPTVAAAQPSLNHIAFTINAPQQRFPFPVNFSVPPPPIPAAVGQKKTPVFDDSVPGSQSKEPVPPGMNSVWGESLPGFESFGDKDERFSGSKDRESRDKDSRRRSSRDDDTRERKRDRDRDKDRDKEREKDREVKDDKDERHHRSSSKRKKRSRSRSRERSKERKHKHSRHSESKEKEKSSGKKRKRSSRSRSKSSDRRLEKERRKQGLPSIKSKHVAVCSRTLFFGRLPPSCQEEDLIDCVKEYGIPEKVNLISGRGCAFVTMVDRRTAYKILDKLRDTRIKGKNIKMDWAPNVGVKQIKDDYWDPNKGAVFIPWDKLPDDISPLLDGGVLDVESLPEHLKADYHDRGKIGVDPVNIPVPPKPTDSADSSQERQTTDAPTSVAAPQFPAMPPFRMPFMQPGFAFPPPMQMMMARPPPFGGGRLPTGIPFPQTATTPVQDENENQEEDVAAPEAEKGDEKQPRSRSSRWEVDPSTGARAPEVQQQSFGMQQGAGFNPFFPQPPTRGFFGGRGRGDWDSPGRFSGPRGGRFNFGGDRRGGYGGRGGGRWDDRDRDHP